MHKSQQAEESLESLICRKRTHPSHSKKLESKIREHTHGLVCGLWAHSTCARIVGTTLEELELSEARIVYDLEYARLVC